MVEIPLREIIFFHLVGKMQEVQVFSHQDHWQAIVLYGRNTATYKMALAKVLLNSSKEGLSTLSWDELSRRFLEEYLSRLSGGSPMPQLETEGRLTVMERVVSKHQEGLLTLDQAIHCVGKDAFNDVIRRFHNVSNAGDISNEMFYTFDFGKTLTIKESVNSFEGGSLSQIEEVEARWSLLEGAFLQKRGNYQLTSDLRKTYIRNSSGKRKSLTQNIPFLKGYQGNACFYCGLPMNDGDIHVDHLLPRQVICHDELWNLVLAHGHCNEDKSDRVVGDHFVKKLICRNENIMGSDHPWKNKIKEDLGLNIISRKKTILQHYKNVGEILGWAYWGGGSAFNPEEDPFFKKLVTILSNK